ncbi:hypothetical protein [Clostridium estertheticum]|uniref:hypothetical protein n=1 Tax=Clostridium estertheticum TaxID=238834 RepID=UPI001C0B2287|nr:hypothetical protein [Clostridium estertheticum]MBU3173593.1 hypothetical protein [Clostridium estertheticum]
MDHLIEQFDAFIEFDLSCFKEEWDSKKYKKFNECPSFITLSTTIKSVNILRKYMKWELLTIKNMLLEKNKFN